MLRTHTDMFALPGVTRPAIAMRIKVTAPHASQNYGTTSKDVLRRACKMLLYLDFADGDVSGRIVRNLRSNHLKKKSPTSGIYLQSG